jgi:hypothetical protein
MMWICAGDHPMRIIAGFSKSKNYDGDPPQVEKNSDGDLEVKTVNGILHRKEHAIGVLYRWKQCWDPSL